MKRMREIKMHEQKRAKLKRREHNTVFLFFWNLHIRKEQNQINSSVKRPEKMPTNRKDHMCAQKTILDGHKSNRIGSDQIEMNAKRTNVLQK